MQFRSGRVWRRVLTRASRARSSPGTGPQRSCSAPRPISRSPTSRHRRLPWQRRVKLSPKLNADSSPGWSWPAIHPGARGRTVNGCGYVLAYANGADPILGAYTAVSAHGGIRAGELAAIRRGLQSTLGHHPVLREGVGT